MALPKNVKQCLKGPIPEAESIAGLEKAINDLTDEIKELEKELSTGKKKDGTELTDAEKTALPGEITAKKTKRTTKTETKEAGEAELEGGRRARTKTMMGGYEEKSQKYLLSAMMLPQISGIASEMFSMGKGTTKGLEALTNSISTATTIMGMLPGPVGLIAGGAIGLYGALSGFAKASAMSSAELEEGIKSELEQKQQTLQQTQDSGQQFMAASEALSTAYADETRSVEEMIKLRLKVSESLANIPAEYRAHLMSLTDGD